MIDELSNILREVKEQSGLDFSGIGLVVYDNIEKLPIFPLRDVVPDTNDKVLVSTLVDISSTSSKYHDGFHLISKNWQLTHVSQYFSPPIVATCKLDYSKLFGGRYVAALFGSYLPGVILTGIASSGFGLAIFKGGKEVFFESSR